jgi:hypothetical protein
MLTGATIENYRGFRRYKLEGLTTVNLLVGKNNSGKTALLESIHLLASGGDPAVLLDTASRRGEVVAGGRGESTFLDISHFFHGHDLRSASRFSLTAVGEMPPVTVEAKPLEDIEPDQQRFFEEVVPSMPSFALRIDGGRPNLKGSRPLILSEEGALLMDPRVPSRLYFGEAGRAGPPIVFIAPDSVDPDFLGAMWDRVLREKQEDAVRKAMQILEPGLEDIVFQTGESGYRRYPRAFLGRGGILVSFAGDQRRVPLGSLGDGMRRLLALSISLNHARGGYLLIDEIDTGLHYSIMASMWELVVRTAKQAGIQVFATTHSADCVRGLAAFCKRSPEMCSEVAAHKIDRDLEQSVCFSGSEVLQAVEQDIEIR